MKLKLLLCYGLVALLAVSAQAEEAEVDEDVAEDNAALQIVDDPLDAMGRLPSSVVKKSGRAVLSGSGANVSTGDPYAAARVNADSAPVGDPYAKEMNKQDVVFRGDPYAEIGTHKIPTKASVKIAKKTKKYADTSSKKPVARPKKQVKLREKKDSDGVVQPLASVLFDNSGLGKDPLAAEAQAAVQAIESEARNRENKLKFVAEEHLSTVKREISAQAEQLRRDADAAAQALKAKTEGRVQALIETAEDRIARLNKEVAAETIKLKQDAAQKALLVIDDLENKAAQRRIEKTKKTLALSLGLSEADLTRSVMPKVATHSAEKEAVPSTPLVLKQVQNSSKPDEVKSKIRAEDSASKKSEQVPLSDKVLRVSAEWKNDLSRRFYRDMTTMKDIIVAAETPLEAQDFLKKLEEQNKWFDLTLRSTKAVTDAEYSQLVDKQAQLGRLMQAQQVADDYLDKYTRNMVMDANILKKVRLNLLYELNTRTQQRSSHLDKAMREAPLPDAEIQQLVKRSLGEVSQQFRDIVAQFPDIELGAAATNKPTLSLASVPVAVKKLEEELKEVKDQAALAKKELEDTQKQMVLFQEETVATKDVLTKEIEAKLALTKEKAALVAEKRDLELDNRNIKATSMSLLDAQAHKQVATELALTGAQQDGEKFKKELNLAVIKNVSLLNQKKQLIGSLEGARKDVIQEHLSRAEDVVRMQKTAMRIQDQAKQKIRTLSEAGAKRELSLTADLKQAHEKIVALAKKQSKLVSDLELQRETSQKLKQSLKQAQERAGKAESKAELSERALGESKSVVMRQISLRKQAEKRAKITEELAQQTIDSINSFLKKPSRAKLASRKNLPEEDEFSEETADNYRKQLDDDKSLLENLRKQSRQIVEHSDHLAESLSDDFIKMQEEIEQELRLVQKDTQAEISLAQNRFAKKKPLVKSALVENSESRQVKKVTAAMPGLKNSVAAKFTPAAMPGLSVAG